MSDDAYAALDAARREFINAADRLSNACVRGDLHAARVELIDTVLRVLELDKQLVIYATQGPA